MCFFFLCLASFACHFVVTSVLIFIRIQSRRLEEARVFILNTNNNYYFFLKIMTLVVRIRSFVVRVMSFFVRTKAQAKAQANAQGDLLSIRFELGFSFEGLGVWGSGVAPS